MYGVDHVVSDLCAMDTSPHLARLWLYDLLTQLGTKTSYQLKIMVVAFIGTHIPLLSLLTFFVLTHTSSWGQALSVLGIALVATLIGTGLTLFALHTLLAPVLLTSESLQTYLDRGQLPDLPIHYKDEAGILMRNTRLTVGRLDEAVRYAAYYDDLTGLPNLDLFRDRLQAALSEAPCAVLAIGIEPLQDLRHTLPRSAFDQLLRQITQRLSSLDPRNSLLARFEEGFALFSPVLSTPDQTTQMAQQVIESFQTPFSIEDQEIYLSARIGISLYPDDGQDGDALWQQANAARQQSWQQGRNSTIFYCPERNEQLRHRLRLEFDLREALAQNQFSLHYQPRIDLKTGQIRSVEALLRWQHPTQGWISPAEFISIAEESDLILPIGEWVIREACTQLRTWQAMGLEMVISVNLSARQFQHPDLADQILKILAERDIRPEQLELELTENALIHVEQALPILETLQRSGFSIALDDFGTGFSSLSYLSQFPLHTLKIDRSFIQHMEVDPQQQIIVRAIVALAHSLQLQVTAEGVETLDQLQYLKELNCQEGQGFLFSRPLPPDQIQSLILESQRADVTLHLR